MGYQPQHSVADRRLEEFICRFCPPNSQKAKMGFKIGSTEFLYKKGVNSYQTTKHTSYPLIRFANTLCPRDLPRKPAYIVCHSTDSPSALKVKALGEKLFFMPISELEAYLGCSVESKRDGFEVTLTAPKDRRFLDKEVSTDALKARLEGFLTQSD